MWLSDNRGEAGNLWGPLPPSSIRGTPPGFTPAPATFCLALSASSVAPAQSKCLRRKGDAAPRVSSEETGPAAPQEFRPLSRPVVDSRAPPEGDTGNCTEAAAFAICKCLLPSSGDVRLFPDAQPSPEPLGVQWTCSNLFIHGCSLHALGLSRVRGDAEGTEAPLPSGHVGQMLTVMLALSAAGRGVMRSSWGTGEDVRGGDTGEGRVGRAHLERMLSSLRPRSPPRTCVGLRSIAVVGRLRQVPHLPG